MFQRACSKIVDKERKRLGIGTLSEKTTHAVLKNYLIPKEEFHEVKCEGYVADILYEGEIMEIQTANFNLLRGKLAAFLPRYDVTVVYPIPHIKWVLWIDPDTGAISNRRKSPKTGNYYQVFPELYRIKMFLDNPNLHFRFILIDVEEYRLLNGWSRDRKKGSSRYDRIPVDIQDELMINAPEDYRVFMPCGLKRPFTSRDYQLAARLSRKLAQTALNILSHLGIVKRIGRGKEGFLYEESISNIV